MVRTKEMTERMLTILCSGRRRNLPWTTTVSFVLLSQICGLSYALNLFFLAMIYTPIPLYSTLPPRRDTLWTPRRAVYRVPLVLSLVGLGFAYQNTDNSLASIALRVGYFAVPLYLATAIEVSSFSIPRQPKMW
jgi:hypothetical protein